MGWSNPNVLIPDDSFLIKLLSERVWTPLENLNVHLVPVKLDYSWEVRCWKAGAGRGGGWETYS